MNEYLYCDKLVHKILKSKNLNKNVTFRSYRPVDSHQFQLQVELIQVKCFVCSTELSLLHRNN